jgi:hypothetical protein
LVEHVVEVVLEVVVARRIATRAASRDFGFEALEEERIALPVGRSALSIDTVSR